MRNIGNGDKVYIFPFKRLPTLGTQIALKSMFCSSEGDQLYLPDGVGSFESDCCSADKMGIKSMLWFRLHFDVPGHY